MKPHRTWACALALMVAACGLDGGIKPLRSAIEGHVRFQGTWPDSLVEVRVVTYADYPPAAFTDLIAWSEPLPTRVDEFDYSVPLPPGEYALVVLAGRYLGSGWIPLADYNPDGGTTPETVTIADRTSVARDVDFTIVFSTGSGISGRIILAGAWSDTVSSIRVGALANRMTNPPFPPPFSAADIGNVSDAFDRADFAGSDALAYSLDLAPGVYRTVGVTWMGYRADGEPEDWGNVADIIKLLGRPVLGVYSASGSLLPDSVTVEADRMTEGIDIVVDFSQAAIRP